MRRKERKKREGERKNHEKYVGIPKSGKISTTRRNNKTHNVECKAKKSSNEMRAKDSKKMTEQDKKVIIVEIDKEIYIIHIFGGAFFPSPWNIPNNGFCWLYSHFNLCHISEICEFADNGSIVVVIICNVPTDRPCGFLFHSATRISARQNWDSNIDQKKKNDNTKKYLYWNFFKRILTSIPLRE